MGGECWIVKGLNTCTATAWSGGVLWNSGCHLVSWVGTDVEFSVESGRAYMVAYQYFNVKQWCVNIACVGLADQAARDTSRLWQQRQRRH